MCGHARREPISPKISATSKLRPLKRHSEYPAHLSHFHGLQHTCHTFKVTMPAILLRPQSTQTIEGRVY